MTETQDRKTDDKLLVRYLQGHIMAADSGAQVFEQARRLWADTPYGDRVQALSADVDQDRQELKAIAGGLGAQLSAVKSTISSIGRTLTRLNPLNPTGSRTGLPGQLELETMHSAVAGKKCLWQTMERLAAQDKRIDGAQQQRLIARAEDQQNRLTEVIRETATVRFRRDESL